jgi:hypothetical protein
VQRVQVPEVWTRSSDPEAHWLPVRFGEPEAISIVRESMLTKRQGTCSACNGVSELLAV